MKKTCFKATSRGRLFILTFFLLSLFPCGMNATQLSGTYTINPSATATGTNFKDILSAVQYMTTTGVRHDGGAANTAPLGVSGAVVFNISNGTYTDSILIPSITGASLTNMVTFQSLTLDSTQVTISYPSSATNSVYNFALGFNGGSYITFNKVTISRTGTGKYGSAVELGNGAHNNSFTHDIISAVNNSGGYTTDACIFSSGYANDSANYFYNNLLENANHAVFWHGSSTETSNSWVNNIITAYSGCAFCLTSLVNTSIIGNTISDTASNVAYGISLASCGNGTIIKNNVIYLKKGYLGISDITGIGSSGSTTLIANNFITIGDTLASGVSANLAGILSQNCKYHNYFANSINVLTKKSQSIGSGINSPILTGLLFISSSTSSGYGNNNIENNIVSTTGDARAIMDTGVGYASYIATCNYNDYYTRGANIAVWYRTAKTTLANWVAASNKDSNTLNVNPLYVSTTDLRTFLPSLAGAGKYLSSVTTDIYGSTRSNPPAIGAYEITTGISPLTGCASTTDNYTTPSHAGSSYTWTCISGGSISSGGSTNSVNIAWGSGSSGQLKMKEVNGLFIDSITQTITINPQPGNNAGSPATICNGSSHTIGASSTTGHTYSWTSSPSGFTSTVSNPSVSPTATTTYSLVETITATGCSATNTVVITVNPAPAANAGINDTINNGEYAHIGSSSTSGHTYSWNSNPAGFSSTKSNPTVNPTTTTTYTLTETITATGCSKSNSVIVVIIQPPLQTVTNKEWDRLVGTPVDSVKWSKSVLDDSDYLIMAGNSYKNGNLTIVTVKMDSLGDTIWTRFYRTSTGVSIGLEEYGAAVTTDHSGNIYVAGPGHNTVNSTSKFDYVVLKYSKTGTRDWAELYDGSGGDDIPLGICADGSGNVYVTGKSDGTSTYEDWATIKYNSSGTAQWTIRYDYASKQDIPTGLVLNNAGTHLYVTGGTSNGDGSRAITTIDYNTSDGSVAHSDRQSVVNSTCLDIGTSIKLDGANHIVVGATGSDGSNNYNFRLIQYSTSLSQNWKHDYDGGPYDEGRGIVIDGNNNVIFAGYSQKSTGRDLTTLKYDINGNLIWTQKYTPNLSGNQFSSDSAEPMGLAIDNSGSSYIAASVHNKKTGKLLTLKYDSTGNQQWVSFFHSDSVPDTSMVIANGVNIGKDGSIYSTGTATKKPHSRYVIDKHSQFMYQDIAVYDSANHPLYAQGQVMARFDTRVLNKRFINNKDSIYSYLNTVLADSVYSKINSKLGTDGFNAVVQKIFPFLTTADSIAKTVEGDTIPSPNFWAVVLIRLPYGYNEKAMCDSLNGLRPNIVYAEKNLAIITNNHPNDQFYHDNGTGYFNREQLSLFHDSTGHPGMAGDINAEKAWTYTTGDPSIHVGVIDNGVRYTHADFGYNAVTKKPSVVQDYLWNGNSYAPAFPSSAIMSSKGKDLYDHGTPVGGIIGALRNNSIGVAGIAGGDYSDTTNPKYGVKLLAICNTDTLSFASSISQSILTFQGMGTQLANISEGSYDSTTFLEVGYETMHHTIQQALNTHFTLVASRGNFGGLSHINNHPIYNYPATFTGHELISVNGSDTLGHIDKTTCWYYSDVMAPDNPAMLFTLNNTNDGSYKHFSETSGATPHVTGVAALLLSYLKNKTPKLDEDDIRNVLVHSAVHIQDTLNHSLTDNYRLNAGDALQSVDTNSYKFMHLSSSTLSTTFSFDTAHPTFSGKVLHPTRDIMDSKGNLILSANFPNGVSYTMDVFEVDATVSQGLSSGSTIYDYWPRNANPGSNLYGLYYTDSFDATHPQYINPDVNVTFTSAPTNSAAHLKGYLYRVHLYNGSNPYTWFPFDIKDVNTKAQVSYTLKTNLVATGIPEQLANNKMEVRIYPNPSDNNVTIDYSLPQNEQVNITFIDLQGRIVKTVYAGEEAAGNYKLNADVSNLAQGMYLCRVQTSEQATSLKFLKQVK